MIVETIPVKTIEELHAFLSPVGKMQEFFKKDEQYLFRGEDTSQYRLNPSLFRGDTIQALYGSLRQEPLHPDYYRYEETLQWIELNTLVKFFQLANSAGIDLPYTDVFRPTVTQVADIYRFTGDRWLPEELVELLSLARHYSFPTRMLDWSDNIYTALYFACSNALKRDQTDQHGDLVIYALRSAALSTTAFPIRFVRPLHFYNQNAHAQGGVLSYMETKNLLRPKDGIQTLPPLEELDPTPINKDPLDRQLEDFFAPQDEAGGPYLKKIMLNAEMVTDLYLYLDSLHYSAEKIFPDLYGVVRKMMRDESNWTHRIFDAHKEN